MSKTFMPYIPFLFILILAIVVGNKLFAGANFIEKKSMQKVVFEGQFSCDIKEDSISLWVWQEAISLRKRRSMPFQEYKVELKNGAFKFEIDSLPNLSYASLGISNNGRILPFMKLYVLAPGDDISVEIKDNQLNEGAKKFWKKDNGTKLCSNCYSYTFSGKGALKYRCLTELRENQVALPEVWYYSHLIARQIASSYVQVAEHYFDYMQFILQNQMSVLNKYKKNLAPKEHNFLLADVLGESYNYFFLSMRSSLNLQTDEHSNQEELKQLKEYYQRHFSKPFTSLSNALLAKSIQYPYMLINKIAFENKLFGYEGVYRQIEKQYDGLIRERLLVNFLVDYGEQQADDTLLLNAISQVKHPAYLDAISGVNNQIKIGSQVYDFSLNDAADNTVKLSDFRGRIVFMDLWFTGCGACLEYYKEKLSKIEARFKDNQEVVFLTISVDGDQNKWKKSLASGSYTSSSVINLNTGKLGFKHPIIQQLRINGFPHPLIIDRDGKLLINSSDELRAASIDQVINTINKALLK